MDNTEAKPIQHKENLLLLKIIAIKDCIEKIILQVMLQTVILPVLTDMVAVLSITAKAIFCLILKTFYMMIVVPTKSASTYLENERVLIISGASEVGKEIALELARYNVNRITLWDTGGEQLNEIANEIKQLKSRSKIFTYTLPSLSKESVQDTITKMKFEAGNVSVLMVTTDINTDTTDETMLTVETNALLNIIQQELTMYTLVRCYCCRLCVRMVKLYLFLGCQSFPTYDVGTTSWLYYHHCTTADIQQQG